MTQLSGHVCRQVGMSEFEHERLDVYKVAIEFLAIADDIAATLGVEPAWLTNCVEPEHR